MKEEMKEIVDRSKDKIVVGCRWIYSMRCKSDGTLDQYKTRLVTNGHKIDYEETFAPVAKMNTIRVILSLAVYFGWNLQQFDVKIAFLHGNLEEEVCKLKKTLYELKQYPRAWFERFAQVIISLGYMQSISDHTFFIKHSLDGKLTFLLVYVDDMIVIGDDEIEKLILKEKLATQFEMKELGKLKYFLGIKIAYSEQGMFISQRKYVFDLLKEIRNLRCKISKILFMLLMWSDNLCMIPGKDTFRKLKGSSNKRSTSGYCMFLGGNLVTWRKKKQKMVARSSTKAKFLAMTHSICEGFSTRYDKTQEIDRHFIKDKLDSGLIVIAHVLIGLQVTDVFTKEFLVVRFQKLNVKL
ncbi:hypothetical protein CR513_12941, partial [Mucuna pruriens]